MARYENFSVTNLSVEKILNMSGADITPGANPSGGRDYYVDGNTTNGVKDGLSWETACSTLAAAITKSNADIALSANRWWAKRNRIFVCADTTSEDLVIFPNKCDVIGVGSYDANTKAGITGHHVPANAGNYGTRFFNIWFKGKAAAAPIVTLASTSSGIQFIGCTFSAAVSGTCSTIGIQATASPFLKIIGCRFEGPFSASYITFGAGEAGGTEIIGNQMVDAAAAGIIVNASTTTLWRALISDNFIQATTLCLDENADLFYYTRNEFITAAAVTAGYAEALDVNVKRGANNYLTADNVTNVLFPAVDTTT